MKTILATASGGPSTLSFTRSLRDADPSRTKYRLIGTDCDPFNIHRSEVDAFFICPKATDPGYIPFLVDLIRREKVDFLHSQPEIEAFTIGKYRAEIAATGCRLFMPAQATIELLRDKWSSYQIWQNAGIKVPENIFLNEPADLRRAFDRFGADIWIRETVGAAGKGSLSRPTYETALDHLNATKAWGHAVAAEHLSKETVTWQSIWHDGKLVVAQGRRRLNWAFGNRAQSGVTGLTGVGETIGDPQLDELAVRCIRAADPTPNGIFSVDFTYDLRGVPNPTEINIAKFFTTHHFITRAGCNMPEILVALAFGEYRGPYGVCNPCESGLLWIRGIDIEPVMIRRADFEAARAEFERTRARLK
ncbi:carboxylate--amine ligase [Oleiharenicola sp. Vm1]|uniref:carboxylate--amine ligase n=1 Tax=Oleiharenicola sp. Vm1 TaxID=3398393 RepID=UPI0039F4B314